MRLLPLLALLVLAGCAGMPPPPGDGLPWQQHSAQVASLSQWRAVGKIALRSGEEAESASLRWSQRDEISELLLSGPLGMASTRLVSDGRTLRIQRGDHFEVLDVASPGAVRLNTGWDLPLAALPYWLRGIPQPGAPRSSLTIEQGRLRHLEHAGWTVDFLAYGQFGAYTLPTRLEARREDSKARLVIRDWRPGESP